MEMSCKMQPEARLDASVQRHPPLALRGAAEAGVVEKPALDP